MACLWGIVTDACDISKVKQAFADGGLANEIRRHTCLHGVAPHPLNAAKEFVALKPKFRNPQPTVAIPEAVPTAKAKAKAKGEAVAGGMAKRRRAAAKPAAKVPRR